MTDRLVPLAGTPNFRDLGGYEAASGVTRWGVVYRADKLSALTDGDLDEFMAAALAARIEGTSEKVADIE